jgi:formamidopyrimidine-DNA glycosylase
MKEVWDFNGIGNVYALELLFSIVLYQKKEKVKKQTENHFKYIQRKSQKQ